MIYDRHLSDLISSNNTVFANLMMLEELGLVVKDSNPMINGIVNSVAFMTLGFLPLIPYFISFYGVKDNTTQHLWVVAIGAA